MPCWEVAMVCAQDQQQDHVVHVCPQLLGTYACFVHVVGEWLVQYLRDQGCSSHTVAGACWLGKVGNHSAHYLNSFGFSVICGFDFLLNNSMTNTNRSPQVSRPVRIALLHSNPPLPEASGALLMPTGLSNSWTRRPGG